MSSLPGYRPEIRIDVSIRELNGALGDLVTVLPLLVALGATTAVPLSRALLLFGAFQVVWGLWYGFPLSVEPMKALVGLAIAGGLTYPELAAGGLLAGGTLLALSRVDGLDRLQRVLGTPVVRGVQLAVALLLAQAGLELAVADARLAALGLAVAVGVVAAGYRSASALAVLAVGAALAAASTGAPAPSLPSPALALFPGGRPALTPAAVEATVAQFAMTVGNAAVATSLLIGDLFDRDVSADELADSMGAMNLAAVPLGGVPMCHGSGGLAGKYAFGARTAGANLALGGIYVAVALVAGTGLLAAFPMALLGVLLVAVAAQLGRAAAETDHLATTAVVGVLGLLVNVGVAFLVGAVGYWLLRRREGAV